MKKIITLALAISLWTTAPAQGDGPLTLETCYARATENYPLIKQRELIQQTKDYSISNAAKGIFPVVTLNAQQSYQSDVTSIPSQPGVDNGMPVLSKNQYKVYGDIVTTLYEGGAIKQRKELHTANALIDDQKLEVELYRLRERVNQLYFGILLLDGQLKQNSLLRNDIELGLRKANASIENGTALKSSADVLRAELLKTSQRAIEISAGRTAYVDALSLLVNMPLNDKTFLEKPIAIDRTQDITRPELKLYQYQYSALDIQDRMLTSRNLPKIQSFLQVGYGKPALNMLNTQADSYYVTGLRLNWTISGFYTYKKEKALIDVSRRNIDLQRETFVFNTNYTLKQQNAEVGKLQQLVASDDEIISLRTRVKNTASAQLENGTINTSDYLKEVNEEDQARQNKVLHEIQLLMAQYTAQTTAGI